MAGIVETPGLQSRVVRAPAWGIAFPEVARGTGADPSRAVARQRGAVARRQSASDLRSQRDAGASGGKPGFSTLERGCGRETDSLLEGEGFEPSVPPVRGKQFRRGPSPTRERLSKSRAPLLKYPHRVLRPDAILINEASAP